MKYLYLTIFLIVAFLPFRLNSSVSLTTTAVKLERDRYEAIFQSRGEAKAIAKLQDGGQIFISKKLVGNKFKRLKLVAQYTDKFGEESEIDAYWLQPSLVYFMKNDTVLLKWHGGELFTFGLSDVITKKEL